MNYSKEDVEKLANYVKSHTVSTDCSGSLSRDGQLYCVDCRVYQTDVAGHDWETEIIHKHNCITKVAQDVLTTGKAEP